MIAGTEPRAQRMWRGEGGPSGAEIRYKLSAPAATAPRVLIVNAAGDTIARLPGTNVVGLNRVSWNLQASTGEAVAGGGGGGGGGGRRARRKSGTGQRCGLPSRVQSATGRGERRRRIRPAVRLRRRVRLRLVAAAGVEDAVVVAVVAVFGRGNSQAVETGDYRVVLDVGGQKQTQVLRVVRVGPGDVSVLVPNSN